MTVNEPAARSRPPSRRALMGIAVLFVCCAHTREAEEEIDVGIEKATSPWRRTKLGSTIVGSPALERTYCPPPRSQLTWDEMLDCAEYEHAAGDRRHAVDLWVKVAAVGSTEEQRCLALYRIEMRTDGRPLGLVPLSTVNECRALMQANAEACAVTCTNELNQCRLRQQDAATENAIRTAIAAVAWADGSIGGQFLSEELLRNSPQLPRCGEEFTACYRSCTMVR